MSKCLTKRTFQFTHSKTKSQWKETELKSFLAQSTLPIWERKNCTKWRKSRQSAELKWSQKAGISGTWRSGRKRGITVVGIATRKKIGGRKMEEIKPCPFCGSEAHTEEFEGYWSVVCDETFLHTIPHFYLMESEAIDEWNQRAEPKTKRTEWGY